VHRYNHNLETARSYFGSRDHPSLAGACSTCELVTRPGMELCCGGIVGMGETLEQRAELATELASLGPDEVPLNFLNPRPGTRWRPPRLGAPTRCARLQRSGWRCRAPSCATRADAS
jgi:biotin synthase-like enzyme